MSPLSLLSARGWAENAIACGVSIIPMSVHCPQNSLESGMLSEQLACERNRAAIGNLHVYMPTSYVHMWLSQ